MSEEQQQHAATTPSQTSQVMTKLEENEQQVKNTEISCAKQAENTSTPVPTSTTYGSVDNEIWATITPQQNASLEALHQSIRMGHNSNGEGFHDMENQVIQPQPQQTQPQQQAQQPQAVEEEKPPVGSDEWHKQRRENHKQVERRRRENINEGINEIARIVPGCEKNKGSILNRAAVYIRQLKDTEAATLEKWTLEKLLTDQAISELNRQVEVFKAELERVKLENRYLKRELDSANDSTSEHSKKRKSSEHPSDEA